MKSHQHILNANYVLDISFDTQFIERIVKLKFKKSNYISNSTKKILQQNNEFEITSYELIFPFLDE